MGELFAGPGYRTCSHPGCRWPAVTSLGYDYSTAVAWLEDLSAAPHPAAFELCSVHADRFKPPKGWEMEDRRNQPAPIFAQVEPPGGSPDAGAADKPRSDETDQRPIDQVALPDI